MSELLSAVLEKEIIDYVQYARLYANATFRKCYSPNYPLFSTLCMYQGPLLCYLAKDIVLYIELNFLASELHFERVKFEGRTGTPKWPSKDLKGCTTLL